jgi:hypothetical protein
MKVDFAIAQLALIFLPGIIWANLDRKFGTGPQPQQFTLILRSFLFGVTTYFALFLLYECFGKEFAYKDFGNNSTAIDLFNLKDEVMWSIPISLILSVIWLYSVKFRWIMRFLHKIGATNRYGDEDVWSFTLNSSQAHVEYVHVRDIENGYVFTGWVDTYSENEEFRELLLSDAIVYNDAGVEISKAPYLYLSRNKQNIWIEFPYQSNGDTQDV